VSGPKDGASLTVGIKVSPKYHAWLVALAASRRTPIPTLIDQALDQLARRHHADPPPPRLPGRRSSTDD
jgi:hypothetical protein